MADVYQVVLGAIAVSIMILVPIGCVAVYDLLAGRWDDSIHRWRDRHEATVEHRRNVKALRRLQGVPLEQVAADLRRLRVAVGTDSHRSAAHQMGNRMAYDRVLMQACAMLEIEHELSATTSGLERDIERFRVEAELERAGFVLSQRRYGQSA